MATIDVSMPHTDLRGIPARAESYGTRIGRIFAPLASLRLTVVLFALSIIIIFLGTLAQVEKNMWQVMDDYFRAWFAYVELRILFPPSFFPQMPRLPGGFYFPGGALIGFGLVINLLAAHLIRFRIQARGFTLAIGVIVSAIGCLFTWMVISSGHNAHGLQGEPVLSWSQLWEIVKGSLAVTTLGTMVAAYRSLSAGRPRMGYLWSTAAAALTVLVAWLMYRGDLVRPSDSSLRILWQLIQGGLAGVILLSGCSILFGRRGGIVLIHAGVGLLMFSELMVSKTAVEERMVIPEGSTVNFASDIRSLEFVIQDRGRPEEEIIVPQSILLQRARQQTGYQKVEHADLPFDLQVVEYLPNSIVEELPSGSTATATAGEGQRVRAIPARATGGADSSGAIDMASFYVRIFPKSKAEELGTYLFSQYFDEGAPQQAYDHEQISLSTAAGISQQFDVMLRFKRTYKPYSMQLVDVRKDDYLGTDTPRNYSSDVQVADPSRGVDVFQRRIWMNNPLRYAGETFYQSGYRVGADGREITDLQVVSNRGWMIPYVACMLVAVGMLAHFSTTLGKFMEQLVNPARAGEPPVQPRGKRQLAATHSGQRWWTRWSPVFVVLVIGLWLVSAGLSRPEKYNGMDLDQFGRLPIHHQGRVKPIDTLARNTLQAVSDRDYFEIVSSTGKKTKQPAARWFLDTLTERDGYLDHRVFRIENLDVLDMLKLKPRKHFRYALDELRGQIATLEEETAKAAEKRAKDPTQLTLYDRKLLEFHERMQAFILLHHSFSPTPIPSVPTPDDLGSNRAEAEKTLAQIRDLIGQIPARAEGLARRHPPLVVPQENGKDWLPYASAVDRAYVERIFGREVNPATIHWNQIMVAYANGNASEFNQYVAEYTKWLREHVPDAIDAGRTGFEAFFNRFGPFGKAQVLYVAAFGVTAISWLGVAGALRRTALTLVTVSFLLHTFGLLARIYISGRPPVTNLYSSAIFIGWAGVAMGILFERIYPWGIGNVLSAASGFSTLVIAKGLAGGDTFTVLQAVLDTQFWLSTHVVCITFGYAATYVAGLLALIYVVLALAHPPLWQESRKDLGRMIYGTVCFALFLSFVGTVLGGLWADDSWGRFWGWDPKENGALIIVLWNALILHARWGGMVRDRGIALLAIAGNIVTSWSWFGVNELGVGLHSYGFTEGVVRNLAIFCVAQLVLIGLGALAFFAAPRRVTATQ